MDTPLLLTLALVGALFSIANTTLIWAVLRAHRKALNKIEHVRAILLSESVVE